MLIAKQTPKGRMGTARYLGEAGRVEIVGGIPGHGWSRLTLRTDTGHVLTLTREEAESVARAMRKAADE
jgi:hypothetical protein